MAADISELNLAKGSTIVFPEGKDKLLKFEITLRPDEGIYRSAIEDHIMTTLLRLFQQLAEPYVEFKIWCLQDSPGFFECINHSANIFRRCESNLENTSVTWQ